MSLQDSKKKKKNFYKPQYEPIECKHPTLTYSLVVAGCLHHFKPRVYDKKIETTAFKFHCCKCDNNAYYTLRIENNGKFKKFPIAEKEVTKDMEVVDYSNVIIPWFYKSVAKEICNVYYKLEEGYSNFKSEVTQTENYSDDSDDDIFWHDPAECEHPSVTYSLVVAGCLLYFEPRVYDEKIDTTAFKFHCRKCKKDAYYIVRIENNGKYRKIPILEKEVTEDMEVVNYNAIMIPWFYKSAAKALCNAYHRLEGGHSKFQVIQSENHTDDSDNYWNDDSI